MGELERMLERGFGETQIRVRYAETDQMGVVYHANYLVWFEIGRVEFIRQTGLDYATMEREGAMIAVVEASARYKAPARYDDELLVRTSLVGFRGTIVRFRYQIVRAADELLLCEGETTHIVVGRDMKKRDLPEKYAERFRELTRHMQGKHGLVAAEAD
jgi:acyl-CoA thioester hydrolase